MMQRESVVPVSPPKESEDENDDSQDEEGAPQVEV
jgi:hypothetical protein